MPIDFNQPTESQTVAGRNTTLREALRALVQLLDPAVAGTLSNLPTGAYRLNAGVLERYSGSSWGTQSINGITYSGGGPSVSVAWPIAMGGTGATTAAGARSALGALASSAPNYTGGLTGDTGVVNIGSGQFYKDASGNIGAGTTSPAAKFDAVGGTGIRVNEDGAATKVLTLRSDFAGVGPAINVLTNHSLLLMTNNTIQGQLSASGSLLLTNATGALGYGIGAGGTVTQATNKTTAVTLNKPTGQITMNAASLAAGATVSFTFSNSLIAITDTLSITSSTVSAETNYTIKWRMGAGFAVISVKNESAGALAEAVVLNFDLFKVATS